MQAPDAPPPIAAGLVLVTHPGSGGLGDALPDAPPISGGSGFGDAWRIGVLRENCVSISELYGIYMVWPTLQMITQVGGCTCGR